MRRSAVSHAGGNDCLYAYVRGENKTKKQNKNEIINNVLLRNWHLWYDHKHTEAQIEMLFAEPAVDQEFMAKQAQQQKKTAGRLTAIIEEKNEHPRTDTIHDEDSESHGNASPPQDNTEEHTSFYVKHVHLFGNIRVTYAIAI
ncbi:hypothetical protein RFI_00622, partial [Reticulomyxa filosa]